MIFLLANPDLPVYRFDRDTKVEYRMNLAFDGFIPLLGGQEGLAEVLLKVRVASPGPDEKGSLRASAEMTAFELKFNGESIPLGMEDAAPYFPKTTVTFSPNGKVVSTDAKKVDVPIRLPGLDVQHLAEAVFLQAELPKQALAPATKWSFSKPFGEGPAEFSVETQSVSDGLATLKLKFKQSYNLLEDESLMVVQDEKNAFAKVSTQVDGTGTVVFDLVAGNVRSSVLEGLAKSTVSELASKKRSNRTLKLKFSANRIDPKEQPKS